MNPFDIGFDGIGHRADEKSFDRHDSALPGTHTSEACRWWQGFNNSKFKITNSKFAGMPRNLEYEIWNLGFRG
jgi:hypothetical protein